MPTKSKPSVIRNFSLTLTKESKDPETKRQDAYFDGHCNLNGVDLKFDLHLWTDPIFSKKGGWWACFEGNPDQEGIDSCNLCSGSNDGNGIYTGTVAHALFVATVKQLNADFPKYTVLNDNKGGKSAGWFLFDMKAKREGDYTYSNSRHVMFHWRHCEITCPIHGKVKIKNHEPAV